MTDPVETLLVDVRANTQGFARDVAQLRASFDGTLVDGFARAGGVLAHGLLGALRRGSVGFEDLRRTALAVLDTIAGRAVGALGGLDGASVARSSGPELALGAQVLGGLLGLPGRATGGPVAPGRGYLVGERGPELFVPTSAGRIEPGAAGRERGRDIRVAITVHAPAGTSGPQALQWSSRQIAAAVRRALGDT